MEQRQMKLIRTSWSCVIAVSVLSILLVPNQTSAQNALYVYPKQGQSVKQQEQDQGECHVWAVQNSGYNPYAQAGGSYASGGVVRGAAGGAAVGAVGGAIGDKGAGKGAAIGAGAGALLGGIRQHQHNQRVDSMNQQASAEYRRALRACLEGRGYSVN
jgi:YMGG-like Gly-zipper